MPFIKELNVMCSSTLSDQPNNIIRQLPPELANQIAAGEVVERPSSIIKELVENSIDANATSLVIDIEKGGSQLIRVRDNGIGIAKDQLTLALTRHATSKIYSLDDLTQILTLGFRGEALASMSSVSRLLLTSKMSQQKEAWQAYTEGRDMNVIIKPASHPIGTTVEVRDIFYNTPARRRFLRSEKTEFTHIEETIRCIALNYPHVAFTLSHNGKICKQYLAINEQDDESLHKRLQQALGNSFTKQIQALSWQHEDITLTGWISQNTASTEPQHYFYVNGRFVKDRLARHAILQARHEYLSDSTTLNYVLFLQLPPDHVDVNVHPTKHEVRFQQSRFIHDAIYDAVASTLQQSVPLQNSVSDKIAATDTVPIQPAATSSIKRAQTFYQKPFPIQTGTPPSGSLIEKLYASTEIEKKQLAESVKNYVSPRIAESKSENTLFPSKHTMENEMDVLFSQTFSHSLGRVLMIYHECYAVLEYKQHLALLSLPVAQQLYYQHQLSQQNEMQKESLLVPFSFAIKKQETLQYKQLIDQFRQFNIYYSCSAQKIIITDVPLMLRNVNWQQLLPVLMEELILLPEPASIEQISDKLIKYTVKQQTKWSLVQAVHLIGQLEQHLPALVLSPPAQLLQPIDLGITLALFNEHK